MIMILSLVVMSALMFTIALADMENFRTKIIAIILAALMLNFFIPATDSFAVEKGKEIVLSSISTQYTKTELYNMSDAEKDLLLKTYGGVTAKYWKIDRRLNESRRSLQVEATEQ